MVTVYTLPSCPGCMRTKAWLKIKEIEFDEVDLTADGKVYADIVIKRGFQTAPVVSVQRGDDEVWWAGHDVEKLGEYLD